LASRSSAGPDPAQRKSGEPIAADRGQGGRFDLGEPGEPAVEIRSEFRVMPSDLVDELEKDARPETVHRLGVALPTQPAFGRLP
jgi:hypothetical protein